MLNIPESVKTLFKRDGVRKNFRVHFPDGELADITNDNIVQESVKFTESLCSQDVLKFGLAEASVVEFETVGIPNMFGMTIECGIGIDLSSLTSQQISDIAEGTWDGELYYEPTENLASFQNESNRDRGKYSYSVETADLVEGTKIATGGNAFAKYVFFAKQGETYEISFEKWEENGVARSTYVGLYLGDLYDRLLSLRTGVTSSFTWTATVTGMIAVGILATRGTNIIYRLTGFQVHQQPSPKPCFRVPYGIFKVANCPRDHGAMTRRKVTAYQVDLFKKLLPFPTKSLAKSFNMSLGGLVATITQSGITEKTEATISPCLITNPSLDAGPITGGCLAAGVYRYADNYFYRHIWLCTGTTDNPMNVLNWAECTEDIIYPEGSLNYDQLESLIETIADKLLDAGIDLTKGADTSSGPTLVPIYSDNLEALKAQSAALGLNINDYPSNVSSIIKPRTTWDYYVNDNLKAGNKFLAHSYPVRMNEYNPVIGGTDSDKAFYGESYKTSSPWASHIKSLVFPKIHPTDNVFLMVYDTRSSVGTYFIKLRYEEDGIDEIQFLTEDMDVTSVRQFSVDTLAPFITMHNTGEYTSDFYAYLGGARNITSVLKNAFELYARFYKADRLGQGEAFLLDGGSPIEITPNDYSEMWWDEYDISPIGKVYVNFSESEEDTDSKISIVIGSGLSTYDMSDNKAISSLTNITGDGVKELIMENFAPNASTVLFTPVDLEMKGLPWIEAGDALEITAEDGTVVDTFALRVEINGIQDLHMIVESKGGDVIESEEDEE